MSKLSFEYFGKRAQKLDDYLEIAGRFKMHNNAESYVIQDIIQKLDLKPSDKVIDIGCGAGNLLIPLSFIVKEITGIDHSSCLERLRDRFTDFSNISLLPGNFLDLAIENTFDKILCYSVLHYLTDREEVFLFIKKAIKLLAPGGKALLGDIPNISKKERFLNSEFGRQFNQNWEKWKKKAYKKTKTINLSNEKKFNLVNNDETLIQFDDDLVLEILKKTRRMDYNSYVCEQSSNLPLGYTREDILIVKQT